MFPFGHPFGPQPGVVVTMGGPPVTTVTTTMQPAFQPPPFAATTTTVQSYGYQGVPPPQQIQQVQTVQSAPFQQPMNSPFNTVQTTQSFQQTNFQQNPPQTYQGGYNQQQSNIYQTQQAPAYNPVQTNQPPSNYNQGNFQGSNQGYNQPQQQGGYNQTNYNQGNFQGSNPGQQQGGYNQPQQGGYNQQQDYNQGGYNQQPQNQGGYNQQPQNQGGYNQQPQNQGGYNQQQPSYDQQAYNTNVPPQDTQRSHTPSYHTTTTNLDLPSGFVAPEQTPPPPQYSQPPQQPQQQPVHTEPTPPAPAPAPVPVQTPKQPSPVNTGVPSAHTSSTGSQHLNVPGPSTHTSSAGSPAHPPRAAHPTTHVAPAGPKKAPVGLGGIAQEAAAAKRGAKLHTGPISQQTSASGGQHSYSEQELRAFTDYINSLLANDPALRSVLPMKGTELFTVITESVLLCKLINTVKPGTIDERKIVSNPKSVLEKIQNHELAIKGAKDIGCNIINIGGHDLLEEKPYLLLGMTWQILEKGLLSKVNIEAHPELISLLDASEDMQSFVNKSPSENLLRWFNYHLSRAGHPRRVNNFGKDISDAENYLVLLSQLAPQLVPREAFLEADPARRAQMVCDYAQKMDALRFVTPEDISAGNDKLNLAFTAYLFHKYPGLDVTNDAQKLEEAERLMQEKYQREEMERKARWEAEEAERQRRWLEEENARNARMAAEEEARRKKWEEEEAAMRAKLNEEERKKREELERQEAELRHRQQEAEAAARAQAEERRRQEILAEQARLAEEDRRRRWEAEQALQAKMYAEEEARRRAEEARRAEEMRRQQWEEEQRRAEAERQRIAAEQEAARLKAWDEYNAKQEQLRQQAWATYYQQQQQQTIMQQQMASTTTTVTSFVPPPTTTTTVTTITKSTFPINRLMLHVIRARRLIPTGVVMLPDPYCFISRGGERYKTPHISNTNDPVWNSTYEMRLVSEFDEIIVDVYDRNLIGKDRFMGQVRLSKSDFLLLGERWYPLLSRTYKADQVHGELLIGIDHA